MSVSEGGGSVNRSNTVEVEEKWIQHYSSLHKILLVGEGDFSFALCLASAFGSANNIVATSLESYQSVVSKYIGAAYTLQRLEELGCTILHGVDATRMDSDHDLSDTEFDRIVFNFPHAGFMYPENNRSQIMRVQSFSTYLLASCKSSDLGFCSLHRMLVEGFFRSASEMLTEGGEVHVTHKTGYPYDDWDIEECAEMSGLECVEEVGFYQFCYPGYENKRGDGSRCDRSFNIGNCSTFKFKTASVRAPRAQLQKLSIFDKVLC